MSYCFTNARVLGSKDTIQVDDKELEVLEGDYFFKGLKERNAIIVTSQKPESIVTAGKVISANQAEIDALRKENAELKAKLEKAEALGKDTSYELDSNESVETEKKSKKK